MNVHQRIALLNKLGSYMLSDDEQWKAVMLRAEQENAWFTQEFIWISVRNIAQHFLQTALLEKWVNVYALSIQQRQPKKVGIVMAGNVPLVGFHDFLCVFISGHIAYIKLSSKDSVLLKHLVEKLAEWDERVALYVHFSEQLKSCDAYIATGSNNSGRYFDYYFAKYPHIIRHNRTSVAIIDGNESVEALESLADDVHLYFGLGCRNVTHVLVPKSYDFLPMIECFRKYNYLADFHKYKNNYDYQLAILLMNKQPYMSSESLLLTESTDLFAPVSRLNYSYYTDEAYLAQLLQANKDNLQCVVGKNYLPLGEAQAPQLNDYADGVDTMQFLSTLI